ncbi:MAG TPA: DUF4129 domain-containing protein [Planctomicrobium sp.]|nr:DUF4129 domain-containing protein [Planctomicrobium sp.]
MMHPQAELAPSAPLDPILSFSFLLRCFLLFLIVIVPTTAGVAQSLRPGSITDQDEQAKTIAEDVFSENDYWWKRTSTVKTPTTLLGRIFDWLINHIIQPFFDWLGDLMEWLFDRLLPDSFAMGDWSAGVPFLWGLIFVGAALLIWFIVRQFRFKTAEPEQEVTESSRPVSLLQADFLLQDARDRLKNHDVRGALRQVFLALLARLQDLGHLKYDRSKSNREYHRELRGNHNLTGPFRLISQAFERCWYGGYDVTAGEVAELILRCEQVGTEHEWQQSQEQQ